MILMTDTDVSEQPAAFDIQRTWATNIDFFYPEDDSKFLSETLLLFFFTKIQGVIPKIIIFKLISLDNIWVYNHKY